MAILDRIQRDTISALRAHDEARVSVLRMLSSALQSKQIEKRSKAGDLNSALSDEEEIGVLRTEAKKRTDAAEQFLRAGREDRAAKEKSERSMIEEYLPRELSDEELEAVVARACASLGEGAKKDFGSVMGRVMKEIAGRASGHRVGALVKKYCASAP